jgi:TrpR-related protein YerC/YecD
MIKRRPISSGGPPTEPWLTPATEDLLKTIVALKSVDEARRFLRDLCTIPELQTLAARWQVARLLDQGVHYDEIARRTGVSTATITRINTWRRFGTGGYRLLLDRTKAPRR